VLDAQYFGLAQRRKRVFVIGYLGDWRPAAAVLFECNSLSGNPAPRREAGQSVADTLSLGANQCSGRLGDFTEHVAQIAPTLNANFGQKQGLDNQHIDGRGGLFVPAVAMCLNAGAMGRKDAESETLIPTNRCGEGGAQNSSHQNTAVRRLTPTECERLQGFPDGYTAIPYRGKPADQCPDGPRYKGLGNSMAVPVMRWIGERIAAVESVAGQTEIAA
jgi:DNA (cytosine-5)-methyltransferase 1